MQIVFSNKNSIPVINRTGSYFPRNFFGCLLVSSLFSSMSISQYISKDVRDVSEAFRSLSEEEVTRLQEEVLQMDSLSKCRFARLLVCRGDAIRLMHLSELAAPELSDCCLRYLKTNAVRKSLYSSLKSEETFIRLFTESSERGQQVLLECLVWNKDRPEGCLADRLYDNPSLSLSEHQRYLLYNSCSVKKHMTCECVREGYEKPYYKERKGLMEEFAVQELYKVYNELKQSFSEEKRTAAEKYLPYIRDCWKTWTLDGVSVRVCDLIYDMWALNMDEAARVNIMLGAVNDTQTVSVTSGKENCNKCSRAITGYCHFKPLAQEIIQRAPLYWIQKTHFMEDYMKTKGRFSSVYPETIARLIREAHIIGEEELARSLLPLLGDVDTYRMKGLGRSSILREMKKYLSQEEFATMLNLLMKNILNKLKTFDMSDNISYTCLPELIMELLYLVPSSNEMMASILSLLMQHEKRYKDRSDDTLLFYSLQQKEVPLDFPYQMATKDLAAMYPTARAFESVLCSKGNTYLNTKEATDRMNVLKKLIDFAAFSKDVRVLHRCLTVYTKTELKFTDITLDLSNALDAFSPDVLGLSETSLANSGSAEMAAKAREGIVNALVEWGSMKKGDLMVGPLSLVLQYLLVFASAYPQFEETYTQMMKPIARLLVDKKMQWGSSVLSSYAGGAARKTLLTSKMSEHCPIFEAEKTLLQSWSNMELFMRHKLPRIDAKQISSDVLVSRAFSIPKEINVPPMSRRFLLALLDLLNEDSDASLVMALLNKLIVSNVVKDQDTKKSSTVLFEKDGRQMNHVVTTTIESNDMPMLRELFTDKEPQWKGCLKGLSVVQSLLMLSSELRDCKNLFCASAPTSTSSYRIDTLPVPTAKRCKTKESTFVHLKSTEAGAVEYMLKYCADSLNMDMMMTIDVEMQAAAQKQNTIQNLSLTQEGLVWCLNTLKGSVFQNILSVKGHSSVSISRKLLRVVSEENLRNLFSLCALYFQIVLQGCVLAASLNKSDKPVLDASIVGQIKDLQPAFFNTLTMLLLINRELHFRRVEPKDKMVSINCLAPFVAMWLKSVAQKQKQSMRDVRNEDSFVVAEVKPESVALDFSDNAVMGRTVEILVYSRVVKEFFGKELCGLVDVVSLMDVDSILLICRRMLIVSSFVPYADSLIRRVVAMTTDSATLDKVVGIFMDSSNAITVALMGLVFRVSALPVMASKAESLREVITKMTEYVITNNFQSASAYAIIMRWVFSTILTAENPDLPFLHNLMHTFAKLDMKEKAGQLVFEMAVRSAFMTGNCPDQRNAPNEVLSFVDSMKTVFKEAAPEKQKALNDLLLETVVLFDMGEDDQLLMRQLEYLIALKVPAIPETLQSRCKQVLEQQWRPYDRPSRILAGALLLLFSLHPEDALASVKKGHLTMNALEKLHQEKKKEIADEELRALGVTEDCFSYIRQNGVNDSLLNLLLDTETNGFTLERRIAILGSFVDVDDEFAPLGLYAKALKSGIASLGEEVRPKDCDVDLVKVAAEMKQTMQPWMYYQLIHCYSLLKDFKEKDVMSLLEHFKTTHDESEALLLCMVCGHCSFNDDPVRSVVKSWIVENKVHALYVFTYYSCLLEQLYCVPTTQKSVHPPIKTIVPGENSGKFPFAYEGLICH